MNRGEKDFQLLYLKINKMPCNSNGRLLLEFSVFLWNWKPNSTLIFDTYWKCRVGILKIYLKISQKLKSCQDNKEIKRIYSRSYGMPGWPHRFSEEQWTIYNIKSFFFWKNPLKSIFTNEERIIFLLFFMEYQLSSVRPITFKHYL